MLRRRQSTALRFQTLACYNSANTMARDYYEILGVPRTASADEIKKAHRRLVRKHHPDVNKGDSASTEKFKEAQEAYDVLSDDTKRANYDQFGHAGVSGGGQPGGQGDGDPFEAFRRAQQGARGGRSGGRGPSPQDFNFNGGQGSGDFSEIFESIFGQRGGPGATGRGRARQQDIPRGRDIEHPVTLTFEQAVRGTALPLQINRGGKLETIDIKIPPGVKDGSKIRLKGKGDSAGGEPGDLYIIASVRPHEYFRREGLNILLDTPISIYEALLGTKLEVPTLEGKVTVTIPPGTNSGAKLRIKGMGVKRKEEVGDQFVVVKIIVPKDLNEDETDLIHELQQKHPIEARKDVKW